MAIRTKTIEYAFPTSETSLASATRRDFSAITLYIPETSGRYFLSVVAMVTAIDAVTTAASLTAHLIGCKLGAAAFGDQSVTATIANSGEQQSFLFTRNFTDYFNTNFGAGTSQTCQIGVSFTGLATINIAVKLIITYEFDDSSENTRIKTVRIPIESVQDAQGTSLTEWGTNQVPNLDSFLPEASKVYRDIFFEVWMNEYTNTTTDSQFGLGLDSESADLDGLHENGMNSARMYHYIWKRTDMATNATHAFKAQAPAAMPCRHAACILVVTYEYNHSNSSSIMNSIMFPIRIAPALTGISGGDPTQEVAEFFVEEANPVLRQSGVLVSYTIDAGTSINIAFGSQSPGLYSDTNVLYCGCTFFTLRIDSGSAWGAGISLARGKNVLSVISYSSSSTVLASAIDGLAIINYTSDKHANGDMVHNRTIIANILATAAINKQRQAYIEGGPYPPDELNFWCNRIGILGFSHQGNTNVPHRWFFCQAFRFPGEGPGAGQELLGARFGYTDAELGVQTYFIDCTEKFHKPWDVGWLENDKLWLNGDRNWYWPNAGEVGGMMAIYTICGIEYTVSGTVEGYSGDGSGITVDVFRADNDEKVMQLLTSAGGSFSTSHWIDNTVNLYCVARQDGTHLGRSDDALAT